MRLLTFLLLFSCAAFAQTAQPAQPAPCLTGDGSNIADCEKHFKSAIEWERDRNFRAAVDEFRKALQSDAYCMKCFKLGIQTAMRINDTDGALKLADLAIAAKNPALLHSATYVKGHVLLIDGESRNKKGQLEKATAVFTPWLAEHPDDLDFLFDDGLALAHLDRDPEAAARFKHYLEVAPQTDERRARVSRIVDRPELARARMAPAFVAKDINGNEVSLDALNGRVVLVDFWATWCGPCNEELPHIKKIAQTYAGQPLTVISISWDKDADKWKQFVAKNEMTWTQVRDDDHSITDRFGISAIPHYFTIDTDGVLQTEQLGEGHEIDGKLKKMVADAVKHQQLMQPPAKPGF